MNFNDALIGLKDDLNTINETFILAKEPDENDVDIDIFLTNRSTGVGTRYLMKNSTVPLYFTHKCRGFAYYISTQGLIKAIDLYDSPFTSDLTINWFMERSEKSVFNPSLRILSQEDQLAHSIYKAIKKSKSKRARYEKIMRMINQGVQKEDAQYALFEICKKQQENKKIIQIATRSIQLLYSNECSFEDFSSMISFDSAGSALSNGPKEIRRKIKRGYAAVKHWQFRMCSRQQRLPLVSFVGIDGAGKSSTIDALCSHSGKLNVIKTRMETKIYSGLLINFYMNKIRPALLRVVNKNKLKPIDLLLIYFDTKKKIYGLYKTARKGHIVLIDRWWIDFFITKKSTSLLTKYSGVLPRFLSLPRPDLFVMIDVPVELSMTRRPDENQESLRYKKSKLSAFMLQHFKSDLLIIRGDEAREKNIKKIHGRLYQVWCALLIKNKEVSRR